MTELDELKQRIAALEAKVELAYKHRADNADIIHERDVRKLAVEIADAIIAHFHSQLSIHQTDDMVEIIMEHL